MNMRKTGWIIITERTRTKCLNGLRAVVGDLGSDGQLFEVTIKLLLLLSSSSSSSCHSHRATSFFNGWFTQLMNKLNGVMYPEHSSPSTIVTWPHSVKSSSHRHSLSLKHMLELFPSQECLYTYILSQTFVTITRYFQTRWRTPSLVQ
jgi:hypothetical protein